MNDLINRQRAIEKFEPWLKVKGYSEGELNVLKAVLYELRVMPPTQPEIIRCKDCKHKGTKNCVANAWTTIFGFGVKDDFYCGLAERRTDER